MQYGLLKTDSDWHIGKVDINLVPPSGGSKERHEYLLKLFKLTQDPFVSNDTKWEALSQLEQDASKKLAGLKKVLAGYEQEKRELLSSAIELYKQEMQVRFAIKWGNHIKEGRFTDEMFKESDELERATTNNCFVINGIQISRKPCGNCNVRVRCGNVGGE